MSFSMPGIICLVTENYTAFCCIIYQCVSQLSSCSRVFEMAYLTCPIFASSVFRLCVKQSSKSIKQMIVIMCR